MSDDCSPEGRQKSRVFAYIDAFNIYYGLRHASRDSDWHHLKFGGASSACLGRSLYWLDLQAVVLSQLKRSEECRAIKYFSAPRRVPRLVPSEDPERYIESNERQSEYLDALETRPLVSVHLGWYSENDPHQCLNCGNRWANFEEKVTDVNIATHAICDAYEDKYDTAYIISADADLVPPVGAIRNLGKRVVIGLFPGRKRAKHLRQAASEHRGIKIRSLRDKRLPDRIRRDDLPDLVCPDRWYRPDGWVWPGSPPEPDHARE